MIRLRCVPVLAGVLLIVTAVPLFSQPGRTSQPGHGLFRTRYDSAEEIRVDGTIQELVTRHTIGSPAGVHLLVSSIQGTLDAHLGPFLNKETRAALRPGIPVQIVGNMTELNGHQYLLARQLIFEGRVVTVRSPHGFPMVDLSGHEASQRRLRTQQADGGNR